MSGKRIKIFHFRAFCISKIYNFQLVIWNRVTVVVQWWLEVFKLASPHSETVVLCRISPVFTPESPNTLAGFLPPLPQCSNLLDEIIRITTLEGELKRPIQSLIKTIAFNIILYYWLMSNKNRSAKLTLSLDLFYT
jgi:hypothetical protein